MICWDNDGIILGYLWIYHLVVTNSLPWKDPSFSIGKPSINGSFSMAMSMLNNQRVYQFLSCITRLESRNRNGKPSI